MKMKELLVLLTFVLVSLQLGNASFATDNGRANIGKPESTNPDIDTINVEKHSEKNKKAVILLVPVEESEENENSHYEEDEESEEEIEESYEEPHHSHKTKRCKALRAARRVSPARDSQKYTSASTGNSPDLNFEHTIGKSLFRVASVKDAKKVLKNLLTSRDARSETANEISDTVSKSIDQDSTELSSKNSERQSNGPKKYVCYCVEENCGKQPNKRRRLYGTKKKFGPSILGKKINLTNQDQDESENINLSDRILGAPDHFGCPPGSVLMEEPEYWSRSSTKHSHYRRRPAKKCPQILSRDSDITRWIEEPTKIDIPLTADDRKWSRRAYKVSKKSPIARKVESIIGQNLHLDGSPCNDVTSNFNEPRDLPDYYNNDDDGNNGFNQYQQIPAVPNIVYPAPYYVYPQYPRYPQYQDYNNNALQQSPLDSESASETFVGRSQAANDLYVPTLLGKSFLDIDECVKMFGPTFCITTSTTMSTVGGSRCEKEDGPEDERPTLVGHWQQETPHAMESPRDKIFGHPMNSDKATSTHSHTSGASRRGEHLHPSGTHLGERFEEQNEDAIESRLENYVTDSTFYSGQPANLKFQTETGILRTTTPNYRTVGSKQEGKSGSFEHNENSVDPGSRGKHVGFNPKYAMPMKESHDTNDEFYFGESNENDVLRKVEGESGTELPVAATTAFTHFQGAHRMTSPQFLQHTYQQNPGDVNFSAEDPSEESFESAPEYIHTTELPKMTFYTQSTQSKLNYPAMIAEATTTDRNIIGRTEPQGRFSSIYPTENPVAMMENSSESEETSDEDSSSSSRYVTQSRMENAGKNIYFTTERNYYPYPENLGAAFETSQTGSDRQFVERITQPTPLTDLTRDRSFSGKSTSRSHFGHDTGALLGVTTPKERLSTSYSKIYAAGRESTFPWLGKGENQEVVSTDRVPLTLHYATESGNRDYGENKWSKEGKTTNSYRQFVGGRQSTTVDDFPKDGVASFTSRNPTGNHKNPYATVEDNRFTAKSALEAKKPEEHFFTSTRYPTNRYTTWYANMEDSALSKKPVLGAKKQDGKIFSTARYPTSHYATSHATIEPVNHSTTSLSGAEVPEEGNYPMSHHATSHGLLLGTERSRKPVAAPAEESKKQLFNSARYPTSHYAMMEGPEHSTTPVLGAGVSAEENFPIGRYSTSHGVLKDADYSTESGLESEEPRTFYSTGYPISQYATTYGRMKDVEDSKSPVLGAEVNEAVTPSSDEDSQEPDTNYGNGRKEPGAATGEANSNIKEESKAYFTSKSYDNFDAVTGPDSYFEGGGLKNWNDFSSFTSDDSTVGDISRVDEKESENNNILGTFTPENSTAESTNVDQHSKSFVTADNYRDSESATVLAKSRKLNDDGDNNRLATPIDLSSTEKMTEYSSMAEKPEEYLTDSDDESRRIEYSDQRTSTDDVVGGSVDKQFTIDTRPDVSSATESFNTETSPLINHRQPTNGYKNNFATKMSNMAESSSSYEQVGEALGDLTTPQNKWNDEQSIVGKTNDGSSADLQDKISTENQLSPQDQETLRAAVEKVVSGLLANNFGPDASPRTSERVEVVGKPRSPDPTLKTLFLVPLVRSMTIDMVRSLIHNIGDGLEHSPLFRLADRVIDSALDKVVNDVLSGPIKTTTSSGMADEHRFENGHWTVVPVTLIPKNDFVAQQPNQKVQKIIEDIVERPGLGAATAESPVVRNLIVGTVENILKRDNDFVDRSEILDTLKKVIDGAEKARVGSQQSAATSGSVQPETVGVKKMSGSLKRLPVIRVTEHVVKNGKWYEKQTLLGAEKKDSGLKYSTTNILGDQLDTSTFGYEKSATCDDIPTAKSLDYALIGESEENGGSTEAQTTDGITEGVPSLLRSREHSEEDLENSPIKYYSPNDRILSYIKSHQTVRGMVGQSERWETTPRSFNFEDSTENYWTSGQFGSPETSTSVEEDSMEFAQATLADRDESSFESDESSVGSVGKSSGCVCEGGGRINNGERVASALEASTEMSLEGESDSKLSTNNLSDKNNETAGKEFVGESNSVTIGQPKENVAGQQYSTESSEFSSTIHHLDVNEDRSGDYTTEENLSAIQSPERSTEKAENEETEENLEEVAAANVSAGHYEVTDLSDEEVDRNVEDEEVGSIEKNIFGQSHLSTTENIDRSLELSALNETTKNYETESPSESTEHILRAEGGEETEKMISSPVYVYGVPIVKNDRPTTTRFDEGTSENVGRQLTETSENEDTTRHSTASVSNDPEENIGNTQSAEIETSARHLYEGVDEPSDGIVAEGHAILGEALTSTSAEEHLGLEVSSEETKNTKSFSDSTSEIVQSDMKNDDEATSRVYVYGDPIQKSSTPALPLGHPVKVPKNDVALQEATTPSGNSIGAARSRSQGPRANLECSTREYDPTYFGKINLNGLNPEDGDRISDLTNSDLFYVGDGVRIPLAIRRLPDGSFALSISEKICENFVHRKCPCCVPAEGEIVEKRKRSDEDKESTTKEDRDYDSPKLTESSVYEGESRRRNVRSTSGSRVIATSATPVRNFVKKYNLTLSLGKNDSPPRIEKDEVEDGKIRHLKKNIRNQTAGRAKIANLFGDDNEIQRDESEEERGIEEGDNLISASRESNGVRIAEYNFDTDTNEFVQRLSKLKDAPEEKRAEIVVDALDGLVKSALAKNPNRVDDNDNYLSVDEIPIEIRSELEKKNGPALDEVETNAERYGYQKDNPIMERIRFIKAQRDSRSQYKYQKNIDREAEGRMNMLKTVLHWLRALFLQTKPKIES